MAYYIKVTKQVADKIGAPVENRNKTADGNILLWQADLNTIPGETIFDRAGYVGGVAMNARDAKAEIDGSDEPAEVTVPDRYQDKDNETPADNGAADRPVTLPAGEENGEKFNESETFNKESV